MTDEKENDEVATSGGNWVGQSVSVAAVTGILGAVIVNLDKITPFLREFGLPVVLVMFVLLFGAVIVIMLVKWGLPRVDQIIESIVGLNSAAIDTGRQLVVQGEKQTEILGRVSHVQSDHTEMLHRTTEILHSIQEAVAHKCNNEETRPSPTVTSSSRPS